MNINGCPYKASNNNQCTHKGIKEYKNKKSYCGHKSPDNCVLFRIWTDLNEKSKIKALKSPEDII